MQADLTMGNLASALTLQSEEAALVAELRAGSEQAFAWLIARYHQPIYSLLARTVHDLYFEPKYDEFRPRTIWSLSNAFTSAFKELDPIPQFKATAKLGEFLEARFSQSF